jgi:hypothetical protein
LPGDTFARKTFARKTFARKTFARRTFARKIFARRTFAWKTIAQKTFARMRVSPGKCLPGNSPQGECLSSKCIFWKMSSGQMYLQANVIEPFNCYPILTHFLGCKMRKVYTHLGDRFFGLNILLYQTLIKSYFQNIFLIKKNLVFIF